MNRLGACSWSLEADTPAVLARSLREVGVQSAQVGLDALTRGTWQAGFLRAAFEDAGLAIASGMMGMLGEDYSTLATIRASGGLRPDASWAANFNAARASASCARELGLDLVSFHAGFLPHAASDPERTKLIARLGAVADVFADEGLRLALETGQETAATLNSVLDELDRDNLGVNFDPANMILYAMGDPVEALRILAPRVLQIHIKDARSTETPGEWGREVPVGSGEVDWPAFFGASAEAGLACDLMIEREAGDQRVQDMRTARALVLDLCLEDLS
ncbi:MAG: sugar phosphate isomerase/epimerase family protein [bacterium]|jgi:L-ribulose-5-phosphate 3-epimerase